MSWETFESSNRLMRLIKLNGTTQNKWRYLYVVVCVGCRNYELRVLNMYKGTFNEQH